MSTKSTKPKPVSGSTKKKLGIPTYTEVLDGVGIDVICDRITDGESQRSIAISLGVSVGTLCAWLVAIPTRSARACEARRLSAEYWEREVDTVLNQITDAPGSIAKARELASHYRWRAKAHNPRQYGDRQTLAGDPEAPLVTKTDLGKLTDAELQIYIAMQKKLEGVV